MIMRAVGAMVTAILAPAVAMAQTSPYEEVLPQQRWTLDLGGGPVYGFSANGGGARKTRLTPWASLNYKDRVYANGLDGVGYNFFKADDLRIGVQLRPRYGSGKPEGLDLKRPDFGADAAVYAFKRLPWNVVVGARATRDVSNISDGAQLYASVGRQTLTPIGLVQTIGYARAGDKRAVRAPSLPQVERPPPLAPANQLEVRPAAPRHRRLAVGVAVVLHDHQGLRTGPARAAERGHGVRAGTGSGP